MKSSNMFRRQVVKIETSRLKKANWDLVVSIEELLQRQEIVALGGSQLFRWLDKEVHKTEDNKNIFRDYIVALVCKGKTDFNRACKGFKLNGVEYIRLLGTAGGVKKNTVLFINKQFHEGIIEKIDCGRDKFIPLVPAKYEAYRALVASQSIPITMPQNILVVHDVETQFKDEVMLVDGSGGGRPTCDHIQDYDVTLNASDGYGLCTPSLMAQWSKDIQESGEDELYICGGICIRYAYVKGMIFPFDIKGFAREIANREGTDTVQDVWGVEHEIDKIDLILTTSMLKLWNAYNSIEEYLAYCNQYDYQLSACKVSDRELDDIRELNYQYLQSYDLSEEDLHALCEPTVKWVKDALCGDYESTLRFVGALDRDVTEGDLDYVQALKTNPKMLDDPFVFYKVARLIKKTINNAKIGKLRCEGNYQIIGVDPYILAQSVFGLECTGLLKRGEVYSSYWRDKSVREVVLYRSPMTSHNNIRKVLIAYNEECNKWYRYMNNVMLLNAWDTITMAMNGAD